MNSIGMAVLFPHDAVTGDVTVRVAVSYLAEQSAPATGRWFWSYHIRIENYVFSFFRGKYISNLSFF